MKTKKPTKHNIENFNQHKSNQKSFSELTQGNVQLTLKNSSNLFSVANVQHKEFQHRKIELEKTK